MTAVCMFRPCLGSFVPPLTPLAFSDSDPVPPGSVRLAQCDSFIESPTLFADIAGVIGRAMLSVPSHSSCRLVTSFLLVVR
jgi:hypothetical protein